MKGTVCPSRVYLYSRDRDGLLATSRLCAHIGAIWATLGDRDDIGGSYLRTQNLFVLPEVEMGTRALHIIFGDQGTIMKTMSYVGFQRTLRGLRELYGAWGAYMT
jgi:hypothetical protein